MPMSHVPKVPWQRFLAHMPVFGSLRGDAMPAVFISRSDQILKGYSGKETHALEDNAWTSIKPHPWKFTGLYQRRHCADGRFLEGTPMNLRDWEAPSRLYELVPLNLVTGGWTSLYDGSKYEDSDCKYSDIGPNAVLEKNRRPRLPRYVCPGTPQGDNARTVEETVREIVAVGLCGKTWALSRQDANVGEKYAQNAAPTAEIAADGVQAQERV